MTINTRQSKILEILSKQKELSSSQIIQELGDFGIDISKNTFLRQIKGLVSKGLVGKTGTTGRYLKYFLVEQHPLFKYIDIESYLAKEITERNSKPTFDFEVFEHLHFLFSKTELGIIHEETKKYQERLRKLPSDIIRKETERLTVELSWKSSQIEGNTYSILETETLLKEKIEAKGHDKEEAIMLLNHKKVLEYIFENREGYRKISKQKILDIHAILTRDMNVYEGFRGNLIGITGSAYIPLIGKSQVIKAVEKLIEVVNKINEPIEKAFIMLIMISYIQAFSDGNKRAGRILANAILLAYDYCPLSFRSVDPTEYKKALLVFYEQNHLIYFKKLFIEQYLYSVRNYYAVT
jgi:Fic family protein